MADLLAGADKYSNNGSNVLVYGGTGNDLINAANDAFNYYVYGEGDGKDTIVGYKADDIISLTSGYVSTDKAAFSGSDFVIPVHTGSITLKDLAKSTITAVTITNSDGTTTQITIPQELYGTKSNDTLTNEKSGSEETPFKIDALAGNDKITNTGDYVSIIAGAGNDSITLGGADSVTVHATINGGKGNDIVTITSANHAYSFEYDTADGSDVIYGLGESDTLVFGTDTIGSVISADGKNFIITSGKTSVAVADYVGGETFYVKKGDNEAEEFTLPLIWQGTKNADTLNNDKDSYELYALGGSDNVTNSGASVKIYADVGDDLVSNTGASVTIEAGAGKDTITNEGDGALIYGGAGNDLIINSGSNADNVNVSIYGGDGADTIENTGSGVVIYGDNDNDTITSSGNNVSLYGDAGNDFISVSASATGVEIGGGKGNDTITIESGSTAAHTFVYSSGDGSDNIYGYNANDAITLYDTDGKTTLATTGYTASVSGTNFVITVGEGKSAGKITLHDVVGKVNSAKINGAAVSITQITYGSESADTLTAESNTYLIKALAGNDTVSIGADVTGTSVEGGTGNDYIYGNAKGNVYIYNDGDGNDTIKSFTDNDTITLVGASLSGSVTSGRDFILNIGKGSIVLEDVIGSTVSSVKVGETTLNISTLSPVIIGTTKADSYFGDKANSVTGVQISVGAGNDIVENTGSAVTVSAGAGNDVIYNSGAKGSLLGEAGNDTVENYANTVTIDAGVGNDYIFSAGSEVSIYSGDGNDIIESFGVSDTVNGGAGADYIYSDGTGNFVGGGAGNDTIEIAGSNTTVVYANGDGVDTVYGFTESDTLQIDSAQITGATADGTDVILKISSGSVKLMDMAGQKIHYKDNSGTKETVVSGAITGTARADKIDNTYADFSISALAGNDTVTNSGDNAKIDGGTGADVITNNDASGTSIFGGTGNDVITSTGNSVTIDGGQGHDKITIGSGSSDVTVTGGKGNDTITATGASNVVFNYASGDGRDVIFGFKAGDKLNITGGSNNSETTVVGEDTIVKVGNGSITIEGYTGSLDGSNGNVAVPWFAEDDTNFIGGGANISDITAPDYSVTNVEKTDSADELSQLEKFAASYSGDK